MNAFLKIVNTIETVVTLRTHFVGEVIAEHNIALTVLLKTILSIKRTSKFRADAFEVFTIANTYALKSSFGYIQ